MKVDTMRFIDRWAGIPLSFLFSFLVWFFDLFKVKKNKPDVSRTLFIELSEMGSAILVDPAMRRLQKEGNGELFFAIFKDNAKSLELLNTIPKENIFKMRSDGLLNLAMDVVAFAFWCRRKRITTTIDLELFSRFTAILTGLSSAGSRVGFASFHDEGLYRGFIINHRVRYNAHVHISINFMSLVNTALGYHDTPYPTSPVTADQVNLVKAEIKEEKLTDVKSKILELYPDYDGEKLVLLNANASDLLPQRRWMPENFMEIGRKILEKHEDVLVIATGSPAERDYVQNVVDGVGHGRCVNSAGVFEFDELVPLYSISTLMLTNDSGPAHFASVTETKVFVIFGPETPALYGSLGNTHAFYLGLPCSPCVSAANHRKTSCVTRPCVTGILPEMVLEPIIDYLKA